MDVYIYWNCSIPDTSIVVLELTYTHIKDQIYQLEYSAYMQFLLPLVL